MRIYVAGPVTGMPDLNRRAFDEAADRLGAAGHTPLLPHWFVSPDASWSTAMRRCVETLVKCDGVALLPGWERSRGADVECSLAAAIGMPVMTLGEWCHSDKQSKTNGISPKSNKIL